MTTKIKAGLIALAAVALIALGYGLASWRHQSWIAGYDQREVKRTEEIAAKEAEQNQLRGENKGLREHVAKLSADDEAMKAIIESRGGVIAAEAKNLETINDELKNNLAVQNAPGDKCVRCRQLSADALKRRQVAKPFPCTDECLGANQ